MPFKSAAQERLFQMKAHMNPKKDRRAEGPSAAVARKFIADSKGQDLSKLPEHVGDKRGK